MPSTMELTVKIELELPSSLAAKEPNQLQRTVIHHLLRNDEIPMIDALASLSELDQLWLVETFIQDAQEDLFLAETVKDPTRRQQYWMQYQNRLEQLIFWHEHWSEFHNELLVLLHTVTRRYAPQTLTPEQTKLLLRLTQRLHESSLYREDIFAAKRALHDLGFETTLDLTPVADQLFTSYAQELNRD